MTSFQRAAGDKSTRLDKDTNSLTLVLEERTKIDVENASGGMLILPSGLPIAVDADDPTILSVSAEPTGFNAAKLLTTYEVTALRSGSTKITARQLFKSYANAAQQRRDWLASPILAQLNVTVFGAEYRQAGGTWGNLTYGSTKPQWKNVQWTTMADAGCGPTSLAMVLDFLERLGPSAPHGEVCFAGVTPKDTMSYTSQYGRSADGDGKPAGTSGEIMMDNIGQHWKDYTSRRAFDLEDAKALLKRHKPLVFLAHGQTTWKYDDKGNRVEKTWPGHFMVVLGFEGNGDPFWIADSSQFKGKFISASELKKCKMWVVERWQDAKSVAGD